MPRQKKTDDQSITPVLGTELNSNTLKDHYKGKTISVNQKITPYFGIGDIWLCNNAYWVTLPEDLTEEAAVAIDRALRDEKIVLGKKYIPPVDKHPQTIEEYSKKVQSVNFSAGVPAQIRDMFRGLILNKSKDGWTAFEIASKCLDDEKKTRRRPLAIKFLEDVLRAYDGPLELYSPPEDKQGIKKVRITEDRMVVITNADETIVYDSAGNRLDDVSVNQTGPVLKRPDHIPEGKLSASEALSKEFDL